MDNFVYTWDKMKQIFQENLCTCYFMNVLNSLIYLYYLTDKDDDYSKWKKISTNDNKKLYIEC